jgi:predicted phosphodiesterase
VERYAASAARQTTDGIQDLATRFSVLLPKSLVTPIAVDAKSDETYSTGWCPMAMAKTAQRIEAERLCKEFPDASTASLARRLAKEFKSTFEQARDHIRLSRGAHGAKHRHEAAIIKPLGKSGSLQRFPPSFATPWVPFVVDGCKKVGIISDVHVPYHSEMAIDAAIGYLMDYKPDTLLINGDFADYYMISRWQRDPRKRRFSDELASVVSGLECIRKKFPRVRIIYKDGNHEERWQHFIWNRAPEIYDLPACQMEELLQFKRLKIEHVTDQRIVMLGKLPVLHGHELGKGGFSSPVNPARGVFMKTMHTALVGHGHRTSVHVEPDMFCKEIAVWSTGCLCQDHPEYHRVGKTNKGFATADIAKDGSFNVKNLRISAKGEVRSS